jgi:chromosome partitioning protein
MQSKVVTRSVALANQKGGVGKTTTAIHLAHGLSLCGLRVALLDLDTQGNATVGVGGELGVEGDVRPLLKLPAGFHLLPSNVVKDPKDLDRLMGQLAEAKFDWVVADCPPRMDEWGWAGVRACTDVIVPVQAEFFAMQGLSQILATLESIQGQRPGHARLLGILPTMVSSADQVSLEVLADLRANLGERVLDTTILRDPQVVEAASHGRSLFAYKPEAPATFCFSELVREVLHGRS